MNKFLRQAIGAVYMQAAPGATGGGTGAAAALSAPPAGGTGTGDNGGTGDTPAPDYKGAWYENFKDEGARAWLHSYKGAYPDAEAVTLKALNLEKFIGAEKAGRGVIIPKPDAPESEWNDFYKKVGGVPESHDKYTLPKDTDPKIVEVLSKDPMLEKFQKYAHSIGMPQRYFGDTLKWFMSESKAMAEGKDAQIAQSVEKDIEALKGAWGKDYDANIEVGRRAAAAFVPGANAEARNEFISRIEGALGTKATFEFFHQIGKGMSEDSLITGGGAQGSGAMTPEGARLRIQELKADKEWTRQYLAGDSDKRAEYERLHKLGFGG